MTFPSTTNPTKVRVGLIENSDRVTFRMDGLYRLEKLSGESLREPKSSDLRWRAVVDHAIPAKILYSVLVSSSQKQSEAMALAEEFELRHIPAVVRQIGGPIELDGRIVGDNTLYRVQVGNFSREEDAKAMLDSLDVDYAPRIVREVLTHAKGKIEFFDADLLETFEIETGFRLVPAEATSKITIFGVHINSGFAYEPTEDRVYSGIIECYLDAGGKIAVLNEIPIDDYLKGVVPAEMPATFPREALLAQAIIARSMVMTQKAIKHLNDPYEVCAHVHCQIYSGLTHEDPITNEVVVETRGMVVTHNALLVDAHYSAVCGGHTEDVIATWMTPPMYAGRGVFCSYDGNEDAPDLSTEAGVRKWVRSTPNVGCNLAGYDLPVSSDYGRRHFRWEVSYTRTELEDIILEKTGEDIGTLYDILPIRRGCSGRLMEIEILGSRKNMRLKRELKIRRALARTSLESSCFLIDIVHDSNGNPMEIVFTGAGWGHGVGVCQCGAARMAAEGKTCREIIEHYYPDCKIEKKY